MSIFWGFQNDNEGMISSILLRHDAVLAPLRLQIRQDSLESALRFIEQSDILILVFSKKKPLCGITFSTARYHLSNNNYKTRSTPGAHTSTTPSLRSMEQSSHGYPENEKNLYSDRDLDYLPYRSMCSGYQVWSILKLS